MAAVGTMAADIKASVMVTAAVGLMVMDTPVMGIRAMVMLTMDTRHIGTDTMGVGTMATGTQAMAVIGAATGMPTVLAPAGVSHPLAGFGFVIDPSLRLEESSIL